MRFTIHYNYFSVFFYVFKEKFLDTAAVNDKKAEEMLRALNVQVLEGMKY
jgi:hypothetical protein